MMMLERRTAFLFHAALRRCFPSSSKRNDQTPVQIQLTPDGLVMHASAPEITVIYTDPDQTGNGVFTFPVARFGEFEGKTADRVEISLLRPDLAGARWTQQGRTREIQFPLIEPESAVRLPELPKKFAPLPASFVRAVHEAGDAASPDPSKYAISRVQLSGKKGQVVGTDTRELLVVGGFPFPFHDDLLIPRCGVFGLPPFQKGDDIGIGRTETHLVIRMGPWMFAFFIDTQGRFPDFASIIPKQSQAATRLKLHADDAQKFLDSLTRRINGPAARELAVTLDLMDSPCLRFESEGHVSEVHLGNSSATGKPLRVCLKLHQFLRALELRFLEFEIRDAEKPILARNGDRLYLVVPLSASGALPPRAESSTAPAEQHSSPAVPLEEPRTSKALAAIERPAVSTIVAPARQPSWSTERFDVIGEAEGLREGLFKVAAHAGRILHFLRQVCTQQNVAQFVRTSLLSLTDALPPGGKS